MKRKKEEKELHLVHLVHLLPQQALSMSMVKTAAPVSCQEEQEEDLPWDGQADRNVHQPAPE